MFDVLIDEKKVLEGYDIVTQAGGRLRGTVEELKLHAGGTMEIELRKTGDSEFTPLIAGVEVIIVEVF